MEAKESVAEFEKNSDSDACANRKILHLPLQLPVAKIECTIPSNKKANAR